MQRKRIIAGNFKMNKTASEAVEYAESFLPLVDSIDDVDIVLCPPFPCLQPMSVLVRGSRVGLGGQNLYWEDSGAFTGEVSAPMLLNAGCQYVIIGHSERRAYFGETDATVNKKVMAALGHGLTPIVCVGEVLEEREAGQTETVVERQVRGGLSGLSPEQVASLVLAYEPVWAIGTGKTATPEMAQDVHQFIRRILAEDFGDEAAASVRIQYGGSVKAENVAELIAQPDIDGGLVGGACLTPDGFAKLIENGRP
jgi:triosephosphate isomerase